MRLREDLAEVRHPQAENSVAELQLFNALPSSLALSVDDIVEAVHPPAEMSVLALPALNFIEELLIEARDASALVQALGLEQRVLARPLALRVAGRPLGHQSSRRAGSVLVRPRRASPEAMPARTGRPLRKSSLCAAAVDQTSIIEKARRRENESSGSFFPVPTVYAQQRLSRSGSVGAGPRSGGPTSELHHEVEGRGAWRSVSAQHPQLLQVAPVSRGREL